MNYSPIIHLEDIEVDLFVEDCKLFAVFDSPANVLFSDNFFKNIRSYKDIFATYKMGNNIFFSCKANKSLSFLKICSENDCGVEVSSYYELVDALKFTNKIIASGPAKTKDYLKLSIENNAIISVDDYSELEDIVEINKKTKVLLRLNDVKDGMISRFGINISDIDKCLKLIQKSNIELLGFSFHINNYNLNDRIEAIKKIVNINNKYSLNIKYIDIGGGFPSNYCSKEEFDNFIKTNRKENYFNNKNFSSFYPYYNDIANEKSLDYILNKTKELLNDIEIIIEPGRSILNNCGITIFEVEYVKKLPNGDNVIVTNGNINCLSEQWFNTDYLVEPMLYKKNKESKKLKEPFYASVAGNLCLEQDMITWRKIRFDYLPEKGDYLIYYNTAGYQMDSNESNFHKIPFVKKYIVKRNNKEYIIKEDESCDCKKNN